MTNFSENQSDEKNSLPCVDTFHNESKFNDENTTIKLLSLNNEDENEKKKQESATVTNRIPKNTPKFIAHLKKIKSVQGYIYGILFAFSMCMANILVKLAPSLDGANHGCIRYFVQLVFMSIFIRRNNLNFFGPPSQRRLLIFRGFTGSISIILSFFAIRYLDVSDVETITNSNVLITAIFSRIFLSEKLTISHIVALVLNITGVVFVLRPSFLFGIEQNMEHMFHVNLTKSFSNTTSNLVAHNGTVNFLSKHKSTEIIDHSNREIFESILGVCLVLLSATSMSISHVAVRKLSLEKIHFSVSSVYPAYIGEWF